MFNSHRAFQEELTKSNRLLDRKFAENREESMAEVKGNLTKLFPNHRKDKTFLPHTNLIDSNLIDSNVITSPSVQSSVQQNSPSNETTNFPIERCFTQQNSNFFIKSDTFDGFGSIDSDLRLFEIVANQSDWTVKDKTAHLATLLRGQAQKILECRSFEELKDFEKLKTILNNKFGYSQYLRSHFNVIQPRKQLKDESSKEYAEELEKLARYAYPNCTGISRDNLTCQHFISGLSSRYL